MIEMFIESYIKTGLTVSTKVHWLAHEVYPWIKQWGLKLGSLSEQDGESLHHHYLKYKNYNHIHGENYRCLSIQKWNRERLMPHPKVKSISLDDTEEKDLKELIEIFNSF